MTDTITVLLMLVFTLFYFAKIYIKLINSIFNPNQFTVETFFFFLDLTVVATVCCG